MIFGSLIIWKTVQRTNNNRRLNSLNQIIYSKKIKTTIDGIRVETVLRSLINTFTIFRSIKHRLCFEFIHTFYHKTLLIKINIFSQQIS